MAKETFPNVKTVGTITEFKKKKGCADFKLVGVKITGSQFERIGDMIDEGDPVDVTLQVKQATLAESGKKSMAQTVLVGMNRYGWRAK
jgi:hypothetical protein